MAKNKKAASSSLKKKNIATPEKKTIKKVQPKSKSKPESKPIKLDPKKVEHITNKIEKINNSFECLIKECKTVLSKLTENSLSPTF